ncbi:MAG: weak similarity to aminoglycoside N(6')-acetyltransferase, partial [uncultured Gemmatimonadetes bacterium]
EPPLRHPYGAAAPGRRGRAAPGRGAAGGGLSRRLAGRVARCRIGAGGGAPLHGGRAQRVGGARGGRARGGVDRRDPHVRRQRLGAAPHGGAGGAARAGDRSRAGGGAGGAGAGGGRVHPLAGHRRRERWHLAGRRPPLSRRAGPAARDPQPALAPLHLLPAHGLRDRGRGARRQRPRQARHPHGDEPGGAPM